MSDGEIDAEVVGERMSQKENKQDIARAGYEEKYPSSGATRTTIPMT